jgi:hypothetical protein
VITGSITFSPPGEYPVAKVEFKGAGIKFYLGGVDNAEAAREAIMAAVNDSERLRGIYRRTGCLNWEKMEEACRR